MSKQEKPRIHQRQPPPKLSYRPHGRTLERSVSSSHPETEESFNLPKALWLSAGVLLFNEKQKPFGRLECFHFVVSPLFECEG